MSKAKPLPTLRDLPHHIVRKSRNWHVDTRTGRYIHEANLDALIAREKLAANKDAQIRRARWDLNQD